MSKTTRLYQDTRTASAAGGSHLDKLNDELQDVTRIMTKNMEELLWRGDSLDRKHFHPCAPYRSVDVHRADPRHVAPIDVAALRVGEVPAGGAEYQHPGDDSAVRAHGRRCSAHHHLYLLAIRVRRVSSPDWAGCTLYSPRLISLYCRALMPDRLALHCPLDPPCAVHCVRGCLLGAVATTLQAGIFPGARQSGVADGVYICR